MKSIQTNYPFLYDVLVIAAGVLVGSVLLGVWNQTVMPKITSLTGGAVKTS